MKKVSLKNDIWHDVDKSTSKFLRKEHMPEHTLRVAIVFPLNPFGYIVNMFVTEELEK